MNKLNTLEQELVENELELDKEVESSISIGKSISESLKEHPSIKKSAVTEIEQPNADLISKKLDDLKPRQGFKIRRSNSK